MKNAVIYSYLINSCTAWWRNSWNGG